VPPAHSLKLLSQVFPLDNAVRIEAVEGVPVFRAPPQLQERVEELLEKQQTAELTDAEKGELDRYEELDDFLSLVNRLVQNSTQPGDTDAHAPAA
jgi:hypothetical protein